MPKVAAGNLNTPGKSSQVDAAKHHDMRDTIITVLSDTPTTAAEIKAAVIPHLPPALFP